MTKHSGKYELIIIGAGPAGITAAIYAARKKMDFLIITTYIGGQVTLSSEIENYTGFQFITGEELTIKFQEHLKRYNFELLSERVQKIERKDDFFNVLTNHGNYLSRTIIIATGKKPKKLRVPGEEKLKNKGISYCATCDAPLFENLDVAVIGGGNSGLEVVLQLSKIAKRIFLIESMQQLKADKILIEKVRTTSKKIEILLNTKILEIVGDKAVKGIKLQRNEKESLLPLRGIFVEIGSVPNSELVEFVKKNQLGEIIINQSCETSVPGFFAAGDVTNIPEKQIVVAAGEGCKAALSTFRYLSQI